MTLLSNGLKLHLQLNLQKFDSGIKSYIDWFTKAFQSQQSASL